MPISFLVVVLTFQQGYVVESLVAHLRVPLEIVSGCDGQLALGDGYLCRALVRGAHYPETHFLRIRAAKGGGYLPGDLLVYPLRV